MKPQSAFTRTVLVLPCLLLLALTVNTGRAIAAPADAWPQLWESPPDGQSGSDAGRLLSPQGIAANKSTGHLVVAEGQQSRVSEFGPFGEFIKAWGWGVADGSAELQQCGPGATPPTVSCRAGLNGTGPGQFKIQEQVGEEIRKWGLFGGVAIAPDGSVYVADLFAHRIQKFTPDGKFVMMLGGAVEKGPLHPGDICTAANIAEGDSCGTGQIGTGNGEFSTERFFNGGLVAVGPGEDLYVGDVGRIQLFDPSGGFKGSIPLPAPIAGASIYSLAVTSDGSIYVVVADSNGASRPGSNIYKLGPSGNLIDTLTPSEAQPPDMPVALSVDAGDNLFVAMESFGFDHREVLEFAPDGSVIIGPGEGFAVRSGSPSPDDEPAYRGIATSSVTGSGGVDVYLTRDLGFRSKASVVAYGAGPDKWLPPAVAPEITDQYVVDASTTSAVLGAKINPYFWTDTRYYVEVGEGKCSEGGCGLVQPLPPGALLGSVATSIPVRAQGLEIQGLEPRTQYHYRFVASSGGGGPVRGIGPDEREGVFTTASFPDAPDTGCPNQAYRVGPSANLARCRAYEMVSPLDKNNVDILPPPNFNVLPNLLDQSAIDGESFTFTTSQGFGDAEGAPYVSQYLSSRSGDGWATHGLASAQGISSNEPGLRLDLEYRAFAPDLCTAVFRNETNISLAPGALPDTENLYLRHTCGGTANEALGVGSKPSLGVPSRAEVQELSADGRCVVYVYLELFTDRLWEVCEGQAPVEIAFLPNGVKSSTGGSAGTANDGTGIRTATTAGSISSDGSKVYWTAAAKGEGPLYLRENADKEQSATSGTTCIEPGMGCTIRVNAKPSHFWGASADGNRAVYVTEGVLKAFDASQRKSSDIAGGVLGVVGVSPSAQQVAFASTEQLTPEANNQGMLPMAGKPNLYLYDPVSPGATAFRFIGTLADKDVVSTEGAFTFTPITPEPYKHVSRISTNGRSLAFMSFAELTGYNTVDADSDEPVAEIYSYSEARGLNCVSCNPTGELPSGHHTVLEGEDLQSYFSAALIPPFMTSSHGAHVISADGSRVFFEAFEPLVAADTNGTTDVYQWEAPNPSAAGGRCTADRASYSTVNGGCVTLISSGDSVAPVELLDASPEGRDVFFSTSSSLVSQDPGLIDIYDAREGGGFPQPATAIPCEGEKCQPQVPPPVQPIPQSTLKRQGNPKATCGKGRKLVRRKGRARCVPRHPHHHKKSGKRQTKGKRA